MRKSICTLLIALTPLTSHAWGGAANIPYLVKIVANTLKTLEELERQTTMLKDQTAGIKDRINRIKTIADLVHPDRWSEWKDPTEAINRLRLIYHTLPKEYHSEKADQIEAEIGRAMNLIAQINRETKSAFDSGKELERLGANSSPGVAQKLTASGVGTLIALESQTQVIQSQITSLLAQMIAEGNEKESRYVVSRAQSFKHISTNIDNKDRRFSQQATSMGLSL